MCEDEEKQTAEDSSAPENTIRKTVAIHANLQLCGHYWLMEQKKFGAVQEVTGSHDVSVSTNDQQDNSRHQQFLF